MNRIPLFLGLAAIFTASFAFGLDWPVKLGFQLGFTISVVPGTDDASRDLGLVVAADKIVSDKIHSLTVTGTITNFSDVPRNGIEMHLAADSYLGTGFSRGCATIEPASLPPGGTAAFSAYITLDSEKPRHVFYTVTAF